MPTLSLGSNGSCRRVAFLPAKSGRDHVRRRENFPQENSLLRCYLGRLWLNSPMRGERCRDWVASATSPTYQTTNSPRRPRIELYPLKRIVTANERANIEEHLLGRRFCSSRLQKLQVFIDLLRAAFRVPRHSGPHKVF
jgi:hypothetical protein